LAEVCPAASPAWAFGAFADCQYSPDPGGGSRKYALSEKKLAECVTNCNAQPLEFVVNLGDLIDGGAANLDPMLAILSRLKARRVQVIGNHDLAVADAEKVRMPEKLGMPGRYYDFAVHGWRFAVLNGSDICFQAYPSNSPEYRAAAEYYGRLRPPPPAYDGALGPAQLAWLRGVLERADRDGEPVVLLCHMPVDPGNDTLWNADEVLQLIDAHPCVQLYLSGHNHAGVYTLRKGVHYLTLRGMVETETTAYAVIRVFADRLEVTGFGREPSRILPLRAPIGQTAPVSAGKEP
jgi:manganese-dependent ADP-ribose/CDP-alcohol diphosphatase